MPCCVVYCGVVLSVIQSAAKNLGDSTTIISLQQTLESLFVVAARHRLLTGSAIALKALLTSFRMNASFLERVEIMRTQRQQRDLQ